MAQRKTRSEESKPKKKSALTVLNDSSPVVADEPTSIWKEEVEALLGQKFTNIIEVIDAIADRVCQRLDSTGDANLHEFIVMMLDTDDEIRQELIEMFNLPSVKE